SNLYYTAPCAQLAEMLCTRTGMKKVFFGNSGAEANECAIKVARKWGLDTHGEGHSTIITLKNSFHGRTIATLAATGQDSFHTNFGPFPGGFVYAEANNLADVRRLAEANACCAVMMEMVQGEGGVMALDMEFVKGVEALCREKNMLLVIDEVQTDNGRCGSLYAYMSYGVQPDVVSTAKGLGGGLPIGACMLGERVENTLTPGTHGSTFGGNPVACAGAVSILSRIDGALLESVKEKSAYIVSQLENAPGVKGVSGMGLMLGIETEKPAKEVVSACLEKGVLVLTAKTKLRLLPPLTITMEELEEAISILKAALKPE
ncbi:MAG: aminotransferase class III-fold pyridoxal phosphate-dependent enzyme, partial [Clostridia bacterium]|nr:aminotransferase class III-fold pyridoxal phosphate-dependent enzyme [Clostridia bacterium]